MFRGTRAAVRLATPATLSRAAAFSRSTATLAIVSTQWQRKPAPSQLQSVIRRQRYATKPPLQPNKIDKAAEKEIAQRQFEKPHPDQVSVESSVRHAFTEKTDAIDPDAARDVSQDVGAGVVEDLVRSLLLPFPGLRPCTSRNRD
jgi:hypothetical protein